MKKKNTQPQKGNGNKGKNKPDKKVDVVIIDM